jgi:4-amino-4-deoxy-L-arabinose transferase-like glycosyltransferase
LTHKTSIATVLFIAITVRAISTNFSGFMDATSAIFVLVGALCFGICAKGEWNSDARLNAFSEGAVLSGWIGALLGAVLIGININTQGLDALGPAVAVMLLTLIYGYFVKALVRMVLISRLEE